MSTKSYEHDIETELQLLTDDCIDGEGGMCRIDQMNTITQYRTISDLL